MPETLPPTPDASAEPIPDSTAATAARGTTSTNAATSAEGRPMGVTIITILAAIDGLLFVLGGVFLLIGSSALGIAFDSAALGGLAAVIGAVTLVIGILLLVFAWGAWGLQPWAWTLGVVLEAIAIVLGLFNLFNGSGGAVLSIAIAVVITWYLFQPDVRRAFGRA
jgi:uncharacterized membrane protein (DUF2068 family)